MRRAFIIVVVLLAGLLLVTDGPAGAPAALGATKRPPPLGVTTRKSARPRPPHPEERPLTRPAITSSPDQAFPDIRVPVGNMLHVDGKDQVRAWDFGDDDSAYSELTGYNAAHVYDKEGDYTLAESDPDGANPTTQLVRVLPDERRVTQVPAGANLEETFKRISGDTRLLLPRGATFDVTRWITVHYANIAVGTYGEGDPPILRDIGGKGQVFFVDAPNFSVQGVEFDTDVPKEVDHSKVGRHGIFIRKGSALVRDCKFRNLDNGVQCGPGTIGLLVQENTFTDEMRSCDVWLEGKNIVMLGNTCGNSYHEHNVRSSSKDTSRVLIWGNDFSNPPVGTKETLTFRDGQWLYASNNVFRFGRVQCSEGKVQKEPVCRHIVFDNNTLCDGAYFQVNPGSEDVRVTNNTIRCAEYPDGIRVTGPGVKGIRVENNTRIVGKNTDKPLLQFFSSPEDVTQEGNETRGRGSRMEDKNED